MLATIIALVLVEHMVSMSIRTGQDNRHVLAVHTVSMSIHAGQDTALWQYARSYLFQKNMEINSRTQASEKLFNTSHIFGPLEAMEMMLKLGENNMIARIAGQ